MIKYKTKEIQSDVWFTPEAAEPPSFHFALFQVFFA